MPMRSYKLFWTSAGAAGTYTDAVANIQVIRQGVITNIVFALLGLAGAGTSGFQRMQLSKLQYNTIAVNDTPPEVLAEACIAYGVSGAAAASAQSISNIGIP